MTEQQKKLQQKHLVHMNGLTPRFLPKLQRIIARAEAELGLVLAVVQGFRSAADQAKIAREHPEGTNAAPGWSYHEYGEAADVVIVLPDGSVLWTNADKDGDGVGEYSELAKICVQEGCIWGGTFRSKKTGKLMGDYCHIQNGSFTIGQLRKEAGVA